MQEEIWKDVVWYEGRYKVSSIGRVFSTGNYIDGRKYTPRFITQTKDKGGYCVVRLYKGKKQKMFKVHRLVAMMFIPNPNNYPCVDHINTIRDDNRVENLRWVTYSMNANNKLTKMNLSTAAIKACSSEKVRKERSIRAKANMDKMMEKVKRSVLQFNINGDFVGEYESVSSAAKNIGGFSTCICSVCKGKKKTYYGYIWKYKE